MSDKMMVTNFDVLLRKALQEFDLHHSFFGVKVSKDRKTFISPIGPAAGPHTQLAANCVSAYGAGANHFELKTVQILEGESLGIIKPCIETGHEVYNSEWSTELSIEEATNEYIKAYMLIYVLAIELGLGNPINNQYYMSVGYDLAGIQSLKVDSFINNMMDASGTDEWKNNMTYLKANLTEFNILKLEDLETLSPLISDKITLSTMHGCAKEEIEDIATYLMKEKGLNTFIKMNPTLLGETRVREILDRLGYTHLRFDSNMFQEDMTFEEAVSLIKRMKILAKEQKLEFGIKLTNTFPVYNQNKKLTGESVYLSGTALFPMAINVAYDMAKTFEGDIAISYSGGADTQNIQQLLNTGIYPVTVSSILLKPGGYKNITRMNKKIQVKNTHNIDIEAKQDIEHKQVIKIDVEKLEVLAKDAITSETYKSKVGLSLEKAEDYSVLCAACNNCIDVCPNRANEKIVSLDESFIIHYDHLCNECGNCSYFCIKGYDPYLDKWTIYDNETITIKELQKIKNI